EKSLETKNPREWYYALMDYGAQLPRLVTNPNRKSKHYSVQSQFEGSDRQMRGKIVRELVKYGSLTLEVLLTHESDKERLKRSLKALQKEGFIMEEKGVYTIR